MKESIVSTLEFTDPLFPRVETIELVISAAGQQRARLNGGVFPRPRKNGVYYIPLACLLHSIGKRGNRACSLLKSRLSASLRSLPSLSLRKGLTALISFTRLQKEVELVSSGRQALFILGNLRQDEGYSAEHIGGTMPDFTTVSVQEARLRTIPGRQGRFLNEYIDYIQQLSRGQAGKLHPVEQEKPATIRRRLLSAAKALGIPLVIKRSGSDIYFWTEEREDEQPRPRRPRRGRAGDLLVPNRSFREPEEVRHPEENGHGVTEEDSLELGQTEPVVSDAMRRVDPE